MSRASALSCSRLYAAQPFTYLGILIAEKKLPSKFDKNLPSNLKKNLPSKSRQKVPSKLVKILPSELRKKVLAVHSSFIVLRSLRASPFPTMICNGRVKLGCPVCPGCPVFLGRLISGGLSGSSTLHRR